VDRIANGWRIAKTSWSVLRHDRELIAVPVIAAIAAALVFGAVAGSGFLLLGGTDAAQASDVALWLVLVLAAGLATWVSAIGSGPLGGRGGRADGRRRAHPGVGLRHRSGPGRPAARVGGAGHRRVDHPRPARAAPRVPRPGHLLPRR